VNATYTRQRLLTVARILGQFGPASLLQFVRKIWSPARAENQQLIHPTVPSALQHSALLYCAICMLMHTCTIGAAHVTKMYTLDWQDNMQLICEARMRTKRGTTRACVIAVCAYLQRTSLHVDRHGQMGQMYGMRLVSTLGAHDESLTHMQHRDIHTAGTLQYTVYL